MTAEQGQALWQAPNGEQMKGKRDRALLAVLLACGLRRHELASSTVAHLQQREEHWAIVDLRGKAVTFGPFRPGLGAWPVEGLDNGRRN